MGYSLLVNGTTLEVTVPDGKEVERIKVTSSGKSLYFFKADIVEIMHAKGYTQKSLAKKVGIAQLTIANYVTRRTVPPVDYALRIAEALDVDVKDLWPAR